MYECFINLLFTFYLFHLNVLTRNKALVSFQWYVSILYHCMCKYSSKKRQNHFHCSCSKSPCMRHDRSLYSAALWELSSWCALMATGFQHVRSDLHFSRLSNIGDGLPRLQSCWGSWEDESWESVLWPQLWDCLTGAIAWVQKGAVGQDVDEVWRDAEQATTAEICRFPAPSIPFLLILHSPHYQHLIFQHLSVSSAGALNGAAKTPLPGFQTLHHPPWAQPCFQCR